MSACEKCWAEAFTVSRMGPESQAEAYRRLLDVNEGKPGHEPDDAQMLKLGHAATTGSLRETK